jgi:hypothetical protein
MGHSLSLHGTGERIVAGATIANDNSYSVINGRKPRTPIYDYLSNVMMATEALSRPQPQQPPIKPHY